MLKIQKTLKRGFTLIELAVVITVISLISVGIVSASQIVSNARMSSVVSVYKDTVKSARLFQTIYGALPGDIRKPKIKNDSGNLVDLHTKISNVLETGNGDGYVQLGCNSSEECKLIESYNFYPHLSRSQLFISDGLPSQIYTGGGCNSMDSHSYRTKLSSGDERIYLVPEVMYSYTGFSQLQTNPSTSIPSFAEGQYLFLIKATNTNMGTSPIALRALKFGSLFITNSCYSSDIAYKNVLGADNATLALVDIDVVMALDKKVDGSVNGASGNFVIAKHNRSQFAMSNLSPFTENSVVLDGVPALKMW